MSRVLCGQIYEWFPPSTYEMSVRFLSQPCSPASMHLDGNQKGQFYSFLGAGRGVKAPKYVKTT